MTIYTTTKVLLFFISLSLFRMFQKPANFFSVLFHRIPYERSRRKKSSSLSTQALTTYFEKLILRITFFSDFAYDVAVNNIYIVRNV